MSATTELLLEEIKKTEDAIVDAEAKGAAALAADYKLALETLRKRLVKTADDLHEGVTHVLKD